MAKMKPISMPKMKMPPMDGVSKGFGKTRPKAAIKSRIKKETMPPMSGAHTLSLKKGGMVGKGKGTC